MARWFRFYDEALDNPKVQNLPPALFKAWVNILCIASKRNGRLGSLEDIAFALRMTVKQAESAVTALKAARLIDGTGAVIEPHDWHAMQYSSDSSAERMRRHRQRNGDGERDVTTPSRDEKSDAAEQSRTDTEKNRTEQRERASPAAPPPAKRACRLNIETLPDDWRAFCQQERTDLDADRTFANFKDHFTSSSGRNAAKLDWKAAWRLWVRREKPPPKASLFDPPKPATVEETSKWGRA